ncbi:MAG: hypothetical protein ACK4IX_00035 [Candidatus Sericytochromatia bacterium]
MDITMINNLIKLTEQSLKHIGNLDDWIDQMFTPIKDYTDTAEDLLYPLKFLFALRSTVKIKRLKSFISDYAKTIENNEHISENRTEKLKDYFSKEKNIDCISEIIDSALISRSNKCSSLLGVLAGKLINEKRELTNIEVRISEALRIMLDIDLIHFHKLYNFIKTVQIPSENKRSDFRTHDLYKETDIDSLNLNRFDLECTIEKLKGIQVIGYKSGGFGNSGNSWGAFFFNENSKYLFELIDKSKILN